MPRRSEPEPGSRGDRVQQIKKAYDKRKGRELTVVEFAAELNAQAQKLSLAKAWSGTRFSKVVHGQDPTLDDAAVLLAIDPEHRTWDWLVFGIRAKASATAGFRRATGS
jgi:hypothetical protein